MKENNIKPAKKFAVALLAGVASFTASATLFTEVSNNLHEIRLLATPNTPQAGRIFAKIENAVQAINELNNYVYDISKQVTALDFAFLQVINDLSQITLTTLKQQYPSEIRGEFYSLFRLFSGECFRLNGLIVAIKERLFGAETISIDNLTLTQEELDAISLAAKANA